MKDLADYLRRRLPASPLTRPVYYLLRAAKRSGREAVAFARSLGFIVRRVLPVILVHRRRPVLFNRRLGAGDILCTFPAALQIKARHPGGIFIYNCRAEFACLPRLAGVTDRTADTDIRPVKQYWAFLFRAIHDFRWGEDGKNYYVTGDFPIETFCRQHGVAPTRDHPRLTVRPATSEKIAALLAGAFPSAAGPLIVFHTGPTWAIREWPHAAWCELIARLQAAGFKKIIRVGASKNAFFGDLKTDVIPGVVSLVDQLDLEATIGLIARADLLVGIDSGLLHFAASVQTPAVGIWGPTSPGLRFGAGARQFPVVSAAPCQGCHHRLPCLHWISGCQHDIQCMKGIPAAVVFQACLARLPAAGK